MYRMIFAAALLAASVPTSAALAQATIHEGSQVQPGTYDIEPSHTRVLFSVSHMGFTTWYGEFTSTSGTLTLDPKDVAASKLSITIQTASVSTSNKRLDGELVSAKWFDAAQYPTISFVSTKVTQTGQNDATVTGNLTFHGVTKPVTLMVVFNGAGVNPLDQKYTTGFNVTGRISRADFDQKTDEPMIGDAVDLMISAAFQR